MESKFWNKKTLTTQAGGTSIAIRCHIDVPGAGRQCRFGFEKRWEDENFLPPAERVFP